MGAQELPFVLDGVTPAGEARSREWLEAHGDGSFALGTVSGALTRRYHGLLVAALEPPFGRTVLVSKLDTTMIVDGKPARLDANLFEAATHPGEDAVRRFSLDPFPAWRYEAQGVSLEKTVFAVHGERTTVVRFRHVWGPPCLLELRPLCAMRHFHHLGQNPSPSDFAITEDPRVVRVRRGTLPSVSFSHEGTFAPEPSVWWRFRMPVEALRGLDSLEDIYSPGVIRLLLAPGTSQSIIVSCGHEHSAADVGELEKAERDRRAGLRTSVLGMDRDASELVTAADTYRVSIAGRRTIVAGYPWFEDWGRDTMISMPGLLLVLGRVEEATKLLDSWADELVGGLLPNRFADLASAPEFHTVDAPLLFCEAVRTYLVYGGDPRFALAKLFPRVLEIASRYAQGTFYGIRMDDDGLVCASAPGYALTWMDAVVDGRAITPRRGKPVEIQALWHSALLTAAELATYARSKFLANDLRALARRVEVAFRARFWDERRGYLADLADPAEPGYDGAPFGPGTVDARLRPNQLFAIALGRGLVPSEVADDVLRAVRQRLLTPRGLRTLAPGEPGYRGRFEGNPQSRDGAYHQGTVWPWLLGVYARAIAVTRGSIDDARDEVRATLAPLLREGLREGCLGQLAEVYDGDAPHRPGGCPAQAWSVAEVLRSWLEIVEARGPVASVTDDPRFTPLALAPLTTQD